MIPHREREHAVQLTRQIRAVLLVGVDYDLRVRSRREGVATLREALADCGEVVYLAVLDHGNAQVLVADRLLASSEIDDAEAPNT